MKALFLTNRAPRHQNIALQAAPDFLRIDMMEAPDRAAILSHVAEAEVLISERSGSIDREIVEAGKNLRLIQRLGQFTYDIDLEAARAAGVAVCHAPLLVSTLVAEHVMMQILALAKIYREAAHVMLQPGDWAEPQKCDENYFAYNWTGRAGMRTLAESTVGIVGLGEIGADVARRLQSFGCEVLYYKRQRLPEDVERALAVSYAALDEVCARSDFLCLLRPHGPGAGESIDSAFIERMKAGAFLVSTGASTVLKEADVAAAVLSGRLAGLACDGYVYEPAPLDSPLLELAREHPDANVILSPHIAGGVASNNVAARSREFENIRRLHDGRPLLYRLV
ncbi:NAD(P)-dependent oxidoreductase [Castellaniella sp. GW247-6E4]|uniref:NAD(P)-dependent oxidoreductase n=1 Tax=Castellaniella sp. GW247-6E4 TaxID=3140380 RepID=UPI0033157AF2